MAPPARARPSPSSSQSNVPSERAAPADGTSGSGRPAASGEVSLPERPRLADGIVLAGQTRESAFVDPPWLLERQGEGYVQVTELLYRIAEVLDGQHTYDQIAEHVSGATGRSVTADNIRQLVATQFIKRGLVPLDDGRVVGARPSNRSMLQINMRVRALDARSIDPVVRALQWVYWPPVMVVALLLGLAVEVWLYVIHGVAAGVHDALYAPALLLLTLAGTVVAAGFHELGHAAALRYGGGAPRAMGAGLYLVYPAFYTDVSDNYRLGRWARVRTDLGGFYFNLLFAIGVVGLYAVTGQEVLLVLVSLLNLEVLRQLAPMMRLDGYWALADLTGVPDFLSHMGAFVRSLVPGRSSRSRALPRLKPWAKLVFLAYVLIAVPLMIFQLVLMLRGVPRVLATVWDSGGRQVGIIQQAGSAGEWGGLGLAVLQLLALALPSLAIMFGLVRLGRRVVGGLWRWSRPSAGRRVIAGLGSVVAIAFFAYAWLPARPSASSTSGASNAGPAVTLSGQSSYAPIGANERGTAGDMLAGVEATVQPSTSDATATATAAAAAAAAEAQATGTALSEATPTPGAVTPTAAVTATPAVVTVTPAALAGTPAAVAATPVTPAVAATPAPAIAVATRAAAGPAPATAATPESAGTTESIATPESAGTPSAMVATPGSAATPGGVLATPASANPTAPTTPTAPTAPMAATTRTPAAVSTTSATPAATATVRPLNSVPLAATPTMTPTPLPGR